MSNSISKSTYSLIEDDGELSSLGSLLWMELDLERVIEWMISDVLVEMRDPKTGRNINYVTPRFGIFSTLLQKVPCFIYGLPEMKQKLGNTAFTDGSHIFICDEMYEQLVNDEDESEGREMGVVVLILHELCHILTEDVYRLRQYPSDIANIAQDYIHNTTLCLEFPEIIWAKSLVEYAVGFAPGDIERYPYLSQEVVAEELMNQYKEEEEEKKDEMQSLPQSSSQKGNGKPQSENSQQQKGESGDNQNNNSGDESDGDQEDKESTSSSEQDGDAMDSQGQGKGQSKGQGRGKPSSKNGSGKGQQGENKDSSGRVKFGSEQDVHHHTLEEVIKVLEEANLENVIKKLNLPASTDEEGISKKQEMSLEIKNQSIIETDMKRQELSMPGFPGGHSLDCAKELIKSHQKGKLTWKMKLVNEIWGTGLNFKYNNDIVGDLYFVDEMIDVIGMNYYVGQIVPFKSKDVVAVLIDTSASVGQKDIEAIVAEIIELKIAAGSSSSAYEVLVFSADTVLRGEPIEITEDNVYEFLEGGLQIYGRRGTDLTTAINQTVASEPFKNKKIKSLIYFTDLGDSAPRYEDLNLDKETSITYIAVPSTRKSTLEYFASEVADYAEVIKIREGQEVDLTITPRIKEEEF